jgi:hypothetical protein
MVMAEEEEKTLLFEPEFPKSRVKKIIALDKDVKRVSSEAGHHLVVLWFRSCFVGYIRSVL